MEDVGRVPTDLAPAPPTEPTTIPSVDGWIESLMSCKQLAESDVQRLCEKVSVLISTPTSPTLPCCIAVQSHSHSFMTVACCSRASCLQTPG